jgi:hypothetical protein
VVEGHLRPLVALDARRASGGMRRSRLAEVLRRLATGALVLVFEDIHWAERG